MIILLLRWFLVLISLCTSDSHLTDLLGFLCTFCILAYRCSCDYRDRRSDARLINPFASTSALRSLFALDSHLTEFSSFFTVAWKTSYDFKDIRSDTRLVTSFTSISTFKKLIRLSGKVCIFRVFNILA